MSDSKAAKILKRTWVGGSLTLALAGILWSAELVGGEWPVLAATCVVLGGAIFELHRMGRLAGRGLGWILFWPALLFALSVLWSLDRRSAGVAGGAPSLALGQQYVLVAVWGLAAHFAVRLAQRVVPRGVRPLLFVGALAGVLALALPQPREGLFAVDSRLLLVAVIALVVAGLWPGTRKGLALSLAATLWLIVPLPALVEVAYRYSYAGLVSLIVLAKIGDVVAYYAGNAFGRTHPFPKLSPGKTSAGCVASFVACTVVGALLVLFGTLDSPDLGLVGGALAGAAVNLAAQAGDLLESWAKRRAAVKDSSTLFGPSGGVLDLVDSFLLASPAALWCWPWFLSQVN